MPHAEEVFSGTDGLEVILTFKDENDDLVDLTSGPLIVVMRQPLGTVVQFTDPEVEILGPGQCRFFTEADQLDRPGSYHFQGIIETNDGKFMSEIVRISITPSLVNP